MGILETDFVFENDEHRATYALLNLFAGGIVAGMALISLWVGLGFENVYASGVFYVLTAWLDLQALVLVIHGGYQLKKSGILF